MPPDARTYERTDAQQLTLEMNLALRNARRGAAKIHPVIANA